MPISWKRTLRQYAGRLHRLFENKSEVQIYDYADIHVRMLELMNVALDQKVKVTIITRPTTDFKDKPALEDILGLLKTAGVNLVYKSNIHQKFAVIDRKIVWYGSINLLSFGHAEESIMRLNSSNIASELIRSINY